MPDATADLDLGLGGASGTTGPPRELRLRCLAAGGPQGRPPPLRRLSETKKSRPRAALMKKKTGGDLLSQACEHQVPSALRGLTALFGMGRGVSPSL